MKNKFVIMRGWPLQVKAVVRAEASNFGALVWTPDDLAWESFLECNVDVCDLLANFTRGALAVANCL